MRKLAEIPFDFVRKRVSVIVQTHDGTRMITKGAFHQVLDVCTRLADGRPLDSGVRAQLERLYEAWTRRGIRVLAVAIRPVEADTPCRRDDERDMAFAGFVTFLDRPKEGVAEAIAGLCELGVSIKVITGDSQLVTQHVAALVGLRVDRRC